MQSPWAVAEIYEIVKENSHKVAITAIALCALELGASILGHRSVLLSTFPSAIYAGMNSLYSGTVEILPSLFYTLQGR